MDVLFTVTFFYYLNLLNSPINSGRMLTLTKFQVTKWKERSLHFYRDLRSDFLNFGDTHRIIHTNEKSSKMVEGRKIFFKTTLVRHFDSFML